MNATPRILAGTALLALVLVGCGGSSGSQPTSITRTLAIDSGTAYAPSTATAVDTVGGESVEPIATFSSATAQQVVLWGSRDPSSGAVTAVHEAVYTASDVYPLYAKYDDNGGLASVKDSNTGSYVTFSALDGTSITATGVDGTTGKTGSVRATLANGGVTVTVLDDGSGHASNVVKRIAIPALAKAHAMLATSDPLLGFSTVFRDSATRAQIVDALIHAASLVVQKPFDKIVQQVAGYLLLDQLEASYGDYTAKGVVPTTSTTPTTPQPYVADLP